MIQAPVPNQVKFLIPELIEEIDPLVEPTVENSTAEDVLQDAIADGGVIVNAWDGRPFFRPKIHTGNRAINGTFDTDTDWTKGAAWTISGGTASKGGGGAPADLTQTGRLVLGVVYEVIFTVSGYSGGSITAKAGTAAGTARLANGTFTEDITCAGNTSIVFTGNTASVMSIDNVFYRPKSLWRIDTALQRRPEKFVDFAMVVTQNLHEVYQVACENVLRFFQNTSDALPTDPLVTTKTLYGLLGKPWPFISFDQIDDNGLVSDHADITNILDGGGTVMGWVYIRSDGEGNSGGIANKSQWIVRTGNDDGTNVRIKFLQLTDDVNGEWYVTTTLRGWVHYAITYDALNPGTDPLIYLMGVSATVTETTGATGTRTTDAGDDLYIGTNFGAASTLDGFIAQLRLFTIVKSASEILALHNGEAVAAADRWGNQTALSSSTLVNDSYDTFDGASATGFHAIHSTAGQQRGGTVDEVSFVNGKKYAVEFDYTATSGQLTSVILRTAFTGTDIGGGAQAVVSGFNRLIFTADQTTTGVVEFLNGQNSEYTVANFIVHQIGAVLALESDGINSVFGKWFDKANQHHATLTGVDYWHVPDADNPAYFFQAFDSFNSRYLFNQFNELLEAGQADTRLGTIIYGQMYGFRSTGLSGIALDTGGYQASKNWPGVRIGETDAGVILAEQKFGERPSWNITLLAQDTAGWESIQDMLQRIAGPLYPFYIIWDYSHVRPVIWQVRLDPEVPFTYATGSDPWRGITFGLTTE